MTLNSHKCQREANSRSHTGVDQPHAEAHEYTCQLISSMSEINPETPCPSCHHFILYVSGQCHGFGAALGSSHLPSVQCLQGCSRLQRFYLGLGIARWGWQRLFTFSQREPVTALRGLGINKKVLQIRLSAQ